MSHKLSAFHAVTLEQRLECSTLQPILDCFGRVLLASHRAINPASCCYTCEQKIYFVRDISVRGLALREKTQEGVQEIRALSESVVAVVAFRGQVLDSRELQEVHWAVHLPATLASLRGRQARASHAWAVGANAAASRALCPAPDRLGLRARDACPAAR